MSLKVPGDTNSVARALVVSYAAFRKEVAAGLSKVHADITSQPTTGDYRAPATAAYVVTAADATDLPSLATLCRDIYRVQTTHLADASAHKVADGTNTIAFGLPAVAETLPNLITFITQGTAAYGAHRSQSGVHPTNDSGNAITSAAASDLASAITRANEWKGDLSAHLQASLVSPGVTIVGE